jgi:hypothetical protein
LGALSLELRQLTGQRITPDQQPATPSGSQKIR